MLQIDPSQDSFQNILLEIPSLLNEIEEDMEDFGRLMLIHQLTQKGCGGQKGERRINIARQLLLQPHRKTVHITPSSTQNPGYFLQTMINHAIDCIGNFSEETKLRQCAEELWDTTMHLLDGKSCAFSPGVSLNRAFQQAWLKFTEEFLKYRLEIKQL